MVLGVNGLGVVGIGVIGLGVMGLGVIGLGCRFFGNVGGGYNIGYDNNDYG